MVLFGQVVVGPPGAGKTTYCSGMKMFITELGRKCEVVNLDFANDALPYTPAVDVRDLISLQDTMETHKLGPNGGLVYCMEYLQANLDWLEDQLTALDTHYIIFDCPGQVELYTHHTGFKTILDTIAKNLNCRLCSVHLVDAFYCCQPATFISAVLLVTSTMLRLGLPHVNVLTKVDLLPMYGPLPFKLDFFTECMNLAPLLRYLDGPIADLRATNTEDSESEEDNNNSNNTEDINESDYEIVDETDPTNPVTHNTNTNTNNTHHNTNTLNSHTAPVNTDTTHHNAHYSTTQSNTMHTTSGIQYKNNNNVNKSGRSKLQEKFFRMSSALCEVVDDFGLVSFHPMNIEDVETVGRVLAATDNANGFSLAAYEATEWARNKNNANSNSNGDSTNPNGPGQQSNYDLFKLAARNLESTYTHSMDIQEKYGIL